MSEFFRQPLAWHEDIDRSLPPLNLIADFMTGPKINRIMRRLSRCLKTKPVISKSQFCKDEGIKLAMLNMALNDKEFTKTIWEDKGQVGLIE